MSALQLLVLGVYSAGAFADGLSALFANLNPTGAGCVDPSGYLACYANNNKTSAECAAKCTSGVCQDACGATYFAANIGCWLTSCWNQVYSCGYQGTAIQYLVGTDSVQGDFIPFYPAPDGAPGGCVCNLGEYWSNKSVTINDNPCNKASVGIKGNAILQSCECCYDSSIVSNIYNICPNNDLSALGIASVIREFQLGYNNSDSDKCSVLSTPSKCTSFSVDTHATTFINPGELPSGFPGTEPLSNTGGSITSPGLGATHVFTIFPGYTSTIVAAPYNAKNAASGATATATETGSAATASQKSAGGIIKPQWAGVIGVNVVAWAVLVWL